jgi:phospholipid-binding lipoprotein MlaA
VRNSLYGVGYVDLRAQALETSSVIDTAALDRYLFIRNAYLQRRRYLVYDGKPPPEPRSPDMVITHSRRARGARPGPRAALCGAARRPRRRRRTPSSSAWRPT